MTETLPNCKMQQAVEDWDNAKVSTMAALNSSKISMQAAIFKSAGLKDVGLTSRLSFHYRVIDRQLTAIANRRMPRKIAIAASKEQIGEKNDRLRRAGQLPIPGDGSKGDNEAASGDNRQRNWDPVAAYLASNTEDHSSTARPASSVAGNKIHPASTQSIITGLNLYLQSLSSEECRKAKYSMLQFLASTLDS